MRLFRRRFRKRVCGLYWCPTVGEVECGMHGGFDVCCAHPRRHIPLPEPCPVPEDWWQA